MRYDTNRLEEEGILETARRMCLAARTAPKGKGIDNILTLVLTGQDKNALAEHMVELARREGIEGITGFVRDAENLRSAQAVVLIGVTPAFTGLPYCKMCGCESCDAAKSKGVKCAFTFMDLGIALGSAVAVAAECKVDNRLMFTVGKAAEEMGYSKTSANWIGIPLSATGKNPFFDRKK